MLAYDATAITTRQHEYEIKCWSPLPPPLCHYDTKSIIVSYRGKAPAVRKELPGNLPRGFEYVVSKHRGTALLREETPASQRVYYRCKRSLSITILKVYKISHDQPIAHFGHKGRRDPRVWRCGRRWLRRCLERQRDAARRVRTVERPDAAQLGPIYKARVRYKP